MRKPLAFGAHLTTKTALRDTRAIHPEELDAIVAEIEAAVGTEVPVATVRTVGELVELVDELGRA